ncbi:hypothetical protein BC332_20528 [Capsicum chinense]|nr:hypothetical protein BC332_20528 [Capsicum chinense]
MSLFLTLWSVQTLSDPKVVDGIKIELFGATTIIIKIILEGGLVAVDDGSRSGSGASIGDNDAPLIVFETTSHYDYDHTDCINFSPDFGIFRECSTCKCQECKVDVIVETTVEEHNITVDNPSTASKEEEKVELVTYQCDFLLPPKEGQVAYTRKIQIHDRVTWHLVDEVYIPINCGDEFHWVLVVVVLKERCIRVCDSMPRRRHSGPSSKIQKLAKIFFTYLDISGFLDQKVCTDWSKIEAYRNKMDNPFNVQYVEGIAQQIIGSLYELSIFVKRQNCNPFVAAYAEYLSDGLQVPNAGLDVG